VAKVHKITERVGTVDRVRDKDALDVLRLLRAVETGFLADRLSLLGATPVSAGVTAEAIDRLPLLFGSTSAEGVRMAVRAAGPDEAPATIASSLVALIRDLLDSL
jgi:hypothetical protein